MAVTITETHSTTLAIAAVVVTNTGGSPVTVSVKRTSGVGAELALRGATGIVLAAGAGKAVYDIEPPLGVSYTYKVYDASTGSVLATSSAVIFDGPWTTDGFASYAWLRHLYDSSLSVPVLIGGLPDITRPAVSESFLPLGATKPSVSSAPRQARTGEITLVAVSDAARLAIRDILADGSPVQIATDRYGIDDGGIYMSVGDYVESRFNNEDGEEVARTIALPFQEVLPPPASAGIAPSYTYLDVVSEYLTYTALDAAFVTYADLAVVLV